MNLQLNKTLIVVGIMLCTLILLKFVSTSENITPNQPFSTFPMQIGPWYGKELHFDDKVYTVLGVDDSVLGNYRTQNGREVQLYVGFYQSQKQGDLIHSPKNCLPGSGWSITSSTITELEIPEADSGRLKAITLILQKGIHKQIMLYWFQSRGRIVTSEYMQKIYLVMDSITRKRTDGSFVRLVAPVYDGDEQKTIEHLTDFTKDLYPVLKRYLPS